ncbi:MAG TPA: methyltransferase domain-containing protein [Candidatus Saccharimonadales bacterium]|nr:methyltransferase domain-containing protein [Candidatus Saccharimonadales bacterium]
MTEQAERYDRIAEGYDRWWAPVLAPSALALLGELDDEVAAGATSILDVGVGTGNLALPAVRRWPTVRVTGIDASREMVRTVEAIATDRLDGPDRQRFEATVAFADALPFDDATFDAAMSSFVLQLVPNRPPALREIRRVLRPGGRLAYVTWLQDARVFEPDRIFNGLLDEFGFEDADGDDRSGDLPSVERAAAELRRAGFRGVTARAATLAHPFTADGYIAFLTEFDEEALFDSMDRAERRRFLATFRERLMALDDERLTFRVPIVYASGVRSDA